MLFHETFVSAPNLGRLHGEVTHCFFDSWSKCWAHVATCDAWNPFPFCSVTDMSQGYTASVNTGFIVSCSTVSAPQTQTLPSLSGFPQRLLSRWWQHDDLLGKRLATTSHTHGLVDPHWHAHCVGKKMEAPDTKSRHGLQVAEPRCEPQLSDFGPLSHPELLFSRSSHIPKDGFKFTHLNV